MGLSISYVCQRCLSPESLTSLAEGWQITHDPLRIKIGTVEMAIDLGAEQLIAAERANEKIAVEIKSFLESASAILSQDRHWLKQLQRILKLKLLQFPLFSVIDGAAAVVKRSQSNHAPQRRNGCAFLIGALGTQSCCSKALGRAASELKFRSATTQTFFAPN